MNYFNSALLVASFLLVSNAFSQQELETTSRIQSQVPQSTNLERYGVDYVVKNYAFNGDSTILYQIDLENLEQFRLSETNAEVIDPNTGLTVVLFYRKNLNGTNFVSEDE